MIFPPVYSSTGGVPHRSSHRLEKSWSKNRPGRSEHATGVEPAGDHQWWAIFLTTKSAKIKGDWYETRVCLAWTIFFTCRAHVGIFVCSDCVVSESRCVGSVY